MYIISFYDLPQGCLAFNDWVIVQGRLKEGTEFVLSKIPFDISFWKSQRKVNAVMIDFTKHSRRNFVIEFFFTIWISINQKIFHGNLNRATDGTVRKRIKIHLNNELNKSSFLNILPFSAEVIWAKLQTS